MRRLIVLFMLTMFVQPAWAALYKCKGADGNIIYTDEACADGKELKLPPLDTYTPAVVPPSFPEQQNDNKDAGTYESLSIIAPKNDENIYNNPGTVTIGYELKPALKTAKGHQFSIALDGKQLKTKGVTNQIKLQNLDRGSHSVQVFVVDDANTILLSSNTITFHLRRKSLIAPIRAPSDEGGLESAPQTGSAPRAQMAPAHPSILKPKQPVPLPGPPIPPPPPPPIP